MNYNYTNTYFYYLYLIDTNIEKFFKLISAVLEQRDVQINRLMIERLQQTSDHARSSGFFISVMFEPFCGSLILSMTDDQ